jgi:hypothetical protein
MLCARSLSVPLIDARRGRRVGELLTFVWVLSLADLLFTLWADAFTPFHELNPLARVLLRHDLIVPLVLMKLTLTGLGTGIFWRLRNLPQAELASWAALLAYVGLLMRWSTYTVAAMSTMA